MEIVLSILSKSDGSTREITREVGAGLVVGRGAEEGILLEGLDLSREHLAFTADETNLYVTDLSVNGTWLNGARLRKSSKSKIRPDDSIEIPGYLLSVRLAEQPAESEVAVVQMPRATGEEIPVHVFKKTKSGPLAMLDPVFRFIGSFTFMEKAMVGVGVCGLILLATYMNS